MVSQSLHHLVDQEVRILGGGHVGIPPNLCKDLKTQTSALLHSKGILISRCLNGGFAKITDPKKIGYLDTHQLLNLLLQNISLPINREKSASEVSEWLKSHRFSRYFLMW